ncbi:MAG TPA: hypothetical protein HA257_10210 [Candidatus Methanoperedenaceae archaeon]|nr:hypothetical protein [Candidatus Methanoperedenaceae archaeon]
MAFAFHRIWDERESLNDSAQEKEPADAVTALESYAAGELRKPEFRRIRIGIDRMSRSMALIEQSWRNARRQHSLGELASILTRLHEIELDAETIKDAQLRAYVHEKLGSIASARRFLAEEVRWDVESGEER